MTYLQELLFLSFAGITFPAQKVSVHGSLRHTVHEYIYLPGGQIETFGRKLYEISVDAQFHTTFRRWPRLTETLRTLATLFDTGGTYNLDVPNMGTMPVKAIDWRRDLVAAAQSGESCTFQFLENQVTPLASANGPVTSSGQFVKAWQDFEIALEEAGLSADPFDTLKGLTNDIAAIGDQADLYGDQLDAKLGSFSELSNALYESNPIFAVPENAGVASKYRDAQYQAVVVRRDSQAKRRALLTYTVPVVMSILQVSRAIYGTTDKALEILRLNNVPDPRTIPGGTVLRYYEPE